jgi:hypothetical protein
VRERRSDRAFRVLARGEWCAVVHIVRVAIQHPQQTVLAGQRNEGALLAADRGRENRRDMGQVVVAHIVRDGLVIPRQLACADIQRHD